MVASLHEVYAEIYITGGKWTTYRSMAEETLDKAIEVCGLKPKRCCQTLGLMLDGAHNWSPTMHIKLVQNFGLDVKVIHVHSCRALP